MKDFYVTFLNLDDISKVYTLEVAMQDTATVEDARKYFYSQACEGRKYPDGSELRALVISVYNVAYIEQMLQEGMELPREIQRFLGDFSFDKSVPLPDEPEGEPYGPADMDPNSWLGNLRHQVDQDDEENDDDDEGEEWKKLL
jgi:hypothetical protein